jgi:antitoxin MazE
MSSVPGRLAVGSLCDYKVITTRDNRMRARLVRIGNSRGVRLPRAVIEEAHLGDELVLTVEDGAVVIRGAAARARWAADALSCRAAHDDELAGWSSTTVDGDWR